MLKNKTTLNHLKTFHILNVTFNLYHSNEKQTNLLWKKDGCMAPLLKHLLI